MVKPAEEEVFYVGLPSPDTINIDEAVDAIFKVWGWPLLGGQSGKGWSYYSVAGRCPQLFKKSYDVSVERVVDPNAPRKLHPMPLQIGALFHVLEALYYGGGLGNAYVLPQAAGRCGGLVTDSLKLPGRRTRFTVPPTAADDLIRGLKALCEDDSDTMLSPDLSIVQVAEQLFDRHTAWWDRREDVTPLGVEVFASHPIGYTCRYDLIARVGKDDPLLPEGVVVFEKKSAAWIDQKYVDAWNLDGEVLGQIMCWDSSGMRDMFGPLAALVVDVVGKGKTPDCTRVILPTTLPAVRQHERWIRWQQAEINMWRAAQTYPQRFMNCRSQYGLCEEFENCKLGIL